jgi:hypothetical protein
MMICTHWRYGWILVWAFATLAGGAQEPRFAKWSKIELSFRGPASLGRGEPNPFAVKLDVEFQSPGARHYCVPGFYDGDGRGSLDGDVWKVRFSADEIGSWTYTTSSDNRQLDGKAGRFSVTDIPSDAEGLWRWGRLEAVGTADNGIRYLKFRNGPYWLKAGCDDPENFLGSCKNYDTDHGRYYRALYLPEGGEVEVNLPAGQNFAVGWWNPDQGRSGKLTHESRIPGGQQTLAVPADGDWAARIVTVQTLK